MRLPLLALLAACNGNDDSGAGPGDCAQPEICDGIDNDCNGEIDDGVTVTVFADADGDGYGDPSTGVPACDVPKGSVPSGDDCDDTDPAVHPDATEVCNGVDDDCDTSTDEDLATSDWYEDTDGDGYGNAAVATNACGAPGGYVADSSDCDDTDTSTNPGAAELCTNRHDDDCNGLVDDCLFDLADATFRLEGLEADDGLGTMVEVADVDSDGVSDLVAGAPPAGHGKGFLAIVHGAATGTMNVADADIVVGGTDEHMYFGASAGFGDSNGDGHVDVVVGAVADDVSYLFYGPLDDAATSDADAILVGETDADDIGVATAIIPDMDGDDHADVVVGADLAGGGRGVVYVLAGNHTGKTSLVSQSTYYFEGASDGDGLGEAVAAFDANGDGIEDLALGAPSHDDLAGAVYVVEGGLPHGGYLVDDDSSLAAIHASAGKRYFGTPIAVTDYDGDGTADLVVGAVLDGGTGSTEGAGVVYALLGPFAGATAAETSAVTTWVDPAGAPGTHLGAFVDADGDVDCDGNDDVLMGSPYAGGKTGPGRAYLQLGVASGVVDVSTLGAFTGSNPLAQTGPVSFVPDWDGDGCDDVAIGARADLDAKGVDGGIVAVVGSQQLR